ncbi:DUF4326 domain-containing protein [Mycobacteroides abscessus]|uniref:DUF4326 domain-containing protein n=2 Tax=Mycobacteroides abscessus TaxID=36809 RepID=A0ABD7HPA1_9MYCO|nr:DUF4326 domain-containing protein [Mycobacteroides abscessus]
MSEPKRIQMTRKEPWRHLHPAAIIVARPTKWGNPCRIGSVIHCSSAGKSWTRRMTAEDAVSYFEIDLRNDLLPFRIADVQAELAGHDLACWCRLEDEHGNRVPCHADVLLEIANQSCAAPNPAVR